MFSAAGNTTNDGLVGALLNDRFVTPLAMADIDSPAPARASAPRFLPDGPPTLRRLAAWFLMAAAAWMLVSPQAVLGLNQLKWMHDYAFRGEVVLGVLVMSASLHLFRNP